MTALLSQLSRLPGEESEGGERRHKGDHSFLNNITLPQEVALCLTQPNVSGVVGVDHLCG